MATSVVDLADVRALAVLERQAKAFMEAMQAAEPAHERLYEAKYPGHIIDWDETAEALGNLIAGLEDLRLADGNQGAADYLFFVKRSGLSLDEAAKTLIDSSHDGLSKVEPMRLYAASLA